MTQSDDDITLEQALAIVAKGGLAALTDENGKPPRFSPDDLIEFAADPASFALVVRDIDENNDKHFSRAETAKFFREIIALSVTEDGKPLSDVALRLRNMIRSDAELEPILARLGAEKDTTRREALAEELIEAMMPRAKLEGTFGAAVEILRESGAAFKFLGMDPAAAALLRSEVDESDKETIEQTISAYQYIAQYDFDTLEAPTAEEVFPAATPAVPPSAKTPKR